MPKLLHGMLMPRKKGSPAPDVARYCGLVNAGGGDDGGGGDGDGGGGDGSGRGGGHSNSAPHSQTASLLLSP